MAHALVGTHRTGVQLAVLFIDLDDFKTVNDSLGHQAGDSVLFEVARRLEQAVRPADTVARFGGDEFAILLDEVDSSDEVAMIADRVLDALEQPVVLEGKEVYARASVGICMSDEDLQAQDPEEFLRNADLAMYMAKRDSKGSYRLFEPTMHERVVERLELRAELQRALELGQFEVYYQPVVHLEQHTDYGVEALLRWNHPERGLVAPAQFIPLAEETGLIVPIGRWVVLEACRQGALLHERFPRDPALTISVNLSVKQLQSDSIIEDVRGALQETGLEPSTLVLEVTETVMMADPDTAAARLNQLKDLGVRIAMDDFGTGYSSLSYLSRLPVDILKMDRSFLGAGNTDSGLAAAIIAIGERLDLEVVAEGIEEPEQIGTLRGLGCELGQGFLFARPMTQPALVDYLDEEDGTRTRTSSRRATGVPRVQPSFETLDRPGGLARVGLLRPLRASRDFRVLWAGMAVSLVGDGIFLIAIAWTAFSLWNAPGALAVIGLAMTVPMIFCLLAGGAVSDRFDRRRVLIVSDLARAAAVAAIAALGFAGALTFPLLAVLAGLYSAAGAFFVPAFDAIVPSLVAADAPARSELARPVHPSHRPAARRPGARRLDRRELRCVDGVRPGRRHVRGLDSVRSWPCTRPCGFIPLRRRRVRRSEKDSASSAGTSGSGEPSHRPRSRTSPSSARPRYLFPTSSRTFSTPRRPTSASSTRRAESEPSQPRPSWRSMASLDVTSPSCTHAGAARRWPWPATASPARHSSWRSPASCSMDSRPRARSSGRRSSSTKCRANCSAASRAWTG